MLAKGQHPSSSDRVQALAFRPMWKLLITKEISRAARGLVGWSANTLADAAGISPDTIRSFESGRTGNLSAANQDAVQKALEVAGVQFLENGDATVGPGVALRQ